MHDTLTPIAVLEQLQRLHIAFPRNLGMRTDSTARQTADVYRNGLRGVSLDGLRFAVDRCLQDDSYFPKIARLRELARDFDLKHRNGGSEHQTDPMWCPRCSTRYRPQVRWRVQADPKQNFAIVTDESGEYVTLEWVERILCDCAPPSVYLPLSDDDPRMPVSKLQTPDMKRCIRPNGKPLRAAEPQPAKEVA